MSENLKYRYTACIPSCLDYEDVFMLACINVSSLCKSSQRVILLMHGHAPSILWAWFPACPLFGDDFVLKSHIGSSSFVHALSRIKKRLLLGGCFNNNANKRN